MLDEAIEELNKRIVLGDDDPDPEVLLRLARDLKRHGSPVGEVMELYLNQGAELLSCLWYAARHPDPPTYLPGDVSASSELLFHLTDGRDVRVVPEESGACGVRVIKEGEEDVVLNVSQACCQFLLKSVLVAEPKKGVHEQYRETCRNLSEPAEISPLVFLLTSLQSPPSLP